MEKNQSITKFAYEILKKKGSPMHYKELTKLIMKKKEIKGKTPWNTVNSSLCTNPKFKRMGKWRGGIYGLADWKDE